MTEKQKVTLNTKAAKNESGNTRPLSSLDNFSSLSSSGLLRKTESVQRTVLSRKAMNLNESENAPSSERRILGGIGGSRGKEFLLLDSGSEAGILRKSQQSSDCCDAQSNETPRAKVAEVAAGKRMLELKNKKDTGIHKKGSPKNDSESGKSMVEMLGVLALMGLLAILGAKGYNMAMERAMANEIINDVNKRSLLHSQQLLAGSALDVSEMPDKIRDIYPVSAEKLGVQFFTLKVSQVETPVCRRIADLGYTVPIQVTANGTKITSDNTTPCENQAGIVEMAFTFNRTLTPCPGCLDQIMSCLNDSSCKEGYSCQDGQCVCQSPCGTSGCCLSGQVCSNNKCVQPVCVSDEDCENGSCLGGQCGCQSFRDCSPNRYCILAEGWNGGGIGRCSSSSDVSGSEGGYIWSAKKNVLVYS